MSSNVYVTQLLCNRKSSELNVGRIFCWREDPFRIRPLGGTNINYAPQLSLKFQILTAIRLIVLSGDSLVYCLSEYLVVLLHTISLSHDAIRGRYQDILYFLSQVHDKIKRYSRGF